MAFIKRDLVSLLRFPFRSHVLVFSCAISPVGRLKYPYSCFSSHLYFVVIVVLLTFTLSALWLANEISFSFLFLMKSLNRRIDSSTLSSMSTTSLPPFFLVGHLSDLKPCESLSFLFLWSVRWSSSFAHFKNGPKYLTRGYTRCLSLWWNFCSRAWFQEVVINSPFQFFIASVINFMTWSDILYLLRLSIIHVCGTISLDLFGVNPVHCYPFPDHLALLEELLFNVR